MFELTIGEYEDTQSLGKFATENEALIALARYVLAHGDGVCLHPHITQVGVCVGCEVQLIAGEVTYCDPCRLLLAAEADGADVR